MLLLFVLSFVVFFFYNDHFIGVSRLRYTCRDASWGGEPIVWDVRLCYKFVFNFWNVKHSWCCSYIL